MFAILAASMLAQASPTSPAAIPQSAPAAQSFENVLRQQGMSEAGVSVVALVADGAGAELARDNALLRAAEQELLRLANAPTVDVTRIADSMRRRDTARAAVVAIQTKQFVQVLQRLSPADRVALLRVSGLARRR